MIGGQALSKFDRYLQIVSESGLHYCIHSHAPTRTMEEAEHNLAFDVSRIVKTVVFRTRREDLILAALRGTRRVDYAALARTLGIGRRDLAALAPNEVMNELGVEPGSVSPVAQGENVALFVDEDVVSIFPTIYCGIGRSDRTLEIAPADLVQLTRAKVATISR